MAGDPAAKTQMPPMNHVVERNIRTLLNRRRREETGQGFQERMAAAITKFSGSMTFVYLHLIIFGAWIAINIGWLPLPKFDPSLVILAMAASVEAIFLSTFVLITQNRMAVLADKRADLNLQISLLAEHEVTRLLTLVTAIAEHLDISTTQDPELSALAQDIDPEEVLDTIEATEQEYQDELRRLH